MNKTEIFKTELNYIKNDRIKRSAEKFLDLLPDYFFTIAASSTGKYHPSFSLGEKGLVRHTKVAVRIAYELLITETFGQVFTEHEKDLIIMALVLHDGVKCGIPESKFTRADHPLLVSKLIMENKDKLKIDIDDIRLLCSLIESHMGQWNKDNYTNKEILPKPVTKLQRFVHMCDYLASRKFLDVQFENNEIIGG